MQSLPARCILFGNSEHDRPNQPTGRGMQVNNIRCTVHYTSWLLVSLPRPGQLAFFTCSKRRRIVWLPSRVFHGLPSAFVLLNCLLPICEGAESTCRVAGRRPDDPSFLLITAVFGPISDRDESDFPAITARTLHRSLDGGQCRGRVGAPYRSTVHTKSSASKREVCWLR